MQQLYDEVIFQLISIKKITKLERKIATKSLIVLKKKKDKTMKSTVCANGSTQQAYILRKEVTIPTVVSEAIIAIVVIDKKQKRDIIMLDIPYVYMQTEITFYGNKIIM